MRKDVKELCVTTWGAVLEFKGWHSAALNTCTGANKGWHTLAHIADPDAIDCGQFISAHEIKLIIRRKT